MFLLKISVFVLLIAIYGSAFSEYMQKVSHTATYTRCVLIREEERVCYAKIIIATCCHMKPVYHHPTIQYHSHVSRSLDLICVGGYRQLWFGQIRTQL